MTGIVRKWGNGLGIRVPQSVAMALNLKPGDPVKFEVRAGTPNNCRNRRRSTSFPSS